jgi:hypothetical protein
MNGAPTGLSSGNPVVDHIGQMHFEGNILDHRWLLAPELRLKSGLINLPALVVLSDLVYWHRPTIVRDELSNAIIAVRKKFEHEHLWKDYDTWGASLGLTKRQVQDAITFLAKAGLVKRTTGRITSRSGFRSNTLPFFTLIPEKLAEITYRHHLPTSNQREAPHVTTGGNKRQSARRGTPQRETKQKPQQENSTDEKQQHAEDKRDPDPLLVKALEARGVSQNVALQLATKYETRCREQLEMLPGRTKTKDEAATLVASIKQNWKPTKAWLDEQRQQRTDEEQMIQELIERTSAQPPQNP